MDVTYKMMACEHLGEDATVTDLEWFMEACAARQAETEEDDGAVTAWMWGDGNWWDRALMYCDPPTGED